MGEETQTRDVLAEDEIMASSTYRASFAVLSDASNQGKTPNELSMLIAKRDLIVENNTTLGKAKLQLKPYLDKFLYTGLALGTVSIGTFLTKFWDKLPAVIELLK
jgi:hypothetical protein